MKPSPQFDLQELLEQRLRFETLLANISAKFVNIPASRVDDEIQASQAVIREYLGMDHSAIWQFSGEHNGSFKLTHISREPNLPVPPIGTDGAEYWPWVVKRVLANEIVCVPDTDQGPPEAAQDILSWQRFQVKSALIIPLSAGGRRPVGALTFSHRIGGERDWPELLQQRLRLIAQIFANALDRKLTEEKLLESEARLRLAAESAGVGFWTLDSVNRVLWTTPKLRQTFGLESNDEMDYETFFGMLHPDDVEKVQGVISDAMLTGVESNVEYRIVRPDGTVRNLVSRGSRHSLISAGHNILTGATIDITDRKRAEEARINTTRRVMEAQEAERCRIARELHDDIGQALALLRLYMQRAGQPVSDNPSRRHPDLPELSKEVANIAQRISQISHQLHSSTLDYLGLGTAVESLCRETAGKYGVSQSCVCRQLPAKIDRNVALNIFRVTQEALHNIGKHSGAKHVEVRLTGSDKEVTLSIFDDGRGFDVESSLHSGGLGLISMRERIEMLGGQLELFSSPGEGTQVVARVPIEPGKCQ